ncbi:MAG: hypothetical protein WHS38_08090 [Thermodesulforhabdaceae bacterium]
MGVIGANLSSRYHITPEQLIARLRQLNSLQRELFFVESIGTGKILQSFPVPSSSSSSPPPSFMATLNQAMNVSRSPGSGETKIESDLPELIKEQEAVAPRSVTNDVTDVGELSRRFESQSDPVAGAGTIGYDPNGGTSYGIYQLSSKQGSVDQFIKFLETRRPDWANRLRAAGPPNTGSTSGRFPSEWKAIARESPEEFAKLQQDFIRDRYFEPACAMIKSETGVDIHSEPKALQEMVWSMAVQHGVGGAVTIFKRALRDVLAAGNGQADRISREDIVEQVYALRSTKFSSSPSRIRQAVIRRFEEEKSIVLAGLGANKGDHLSQWS